MATFLLPAPPMAMGTSDIEALDSYRSEEHTSELQSHVNLVCRLLLEKKKSCAGVNSCSSKTLHQHGRTNNIQDRKSTLLNSSHPSISYAVFCLKTKNTKQLKDHNTNT